MFAQVFFLTFQPVFGQIKNFKIPDINANNYSKLCTRNSIAKFSFNLPEYMPDKDLIKEAVERKDHNTYFAEMEKKNLQGKKNRKLRMDYRKKCAQFCILMDKVIPTNEGFVHAGVYGNKTFSNCIDKWVKKINKKGDRIEFLIGTTDRLEGLNEKPQTITDRSLKHMNFQVNCSTWELWDKYDKLWEPISKGTVFDTASEKFCKKNIFKFWN